MPDDFGREVLTTFLAARAKENLAVFLEKVFDRMTVEELEELADQYPDPATREPTREEIVASCWSGTDPEQELIEALGGTYEEKKDGTAS